MNKYLSLYRKEKFYSYKKKKFINYFLKNFFKFKKFLNLFSLITINRYQKNIFLNFANLNDGSVLFKVSCGFYFKRATKKTYYAAESLFKRFALPLKYVNIKKFFFLNIRAYYSLRGFKRILKNYIKTNTLKIVSVNDIRFKAHNGVRKKHQKRK